MTEENKRESERCWDTFLLLQSLKVVSTARGYLDKTCAYKSGQWVAGSSSFHSLGMFWRTLSLKIPGQKIPTGFNISGRGLVQFQDPRTSRTQNFEEKFNRQKTISIKNKTNYLLSKLDQKSTFRVQTKTRFCT